MCTANPKIEERHKEKREREVFFVKETKAIQKRNNQS
jgi:hypothetical protein